MTKKPLVTACLTTFNAERFIRETLQTVKAQTWPGLKVLISDDSSSDDTWRILEQETATHQPVFEIFRQPERLGWVGNTNFLLEKVDTEFFFLCYHDDHLQDDYVAKLATALAAQPDAAGAYGDLERTFDDGRASMVSRYREIEGERDPVKRGESIVRRQGDAWIANRGVFRTSALQVTGGLRYNLAGEFSAAFPWLFGLALEGELVRVPENLCTKHHLASGASSQWHYGEDAWLAMSVDMIETVWRSSLNQEQKHQLYRRIFTRANADLPGTGPAHAKPLAKPSLLRRAINKLTS